MGHNPTVEETIGIGPYRKEGLFAKERICRRRPRTGGAEESRPKFL
jgi:hypothetical protein